MADEKRDPPMSEPGFIAGVTVVDIGDLRVARGLTRRPFSACRHRSLTYDQAERRIWCKDCERDVEHFDAFRSLVENYSTVYNNLVSREKAISELETFKMRTIAGRVMDEAWCSRGMVPACPHCHNGLFPEDFKKGVGMVGKEYAQARLGKKKAE